MSHTVTSAAGETVELLQTEELRALLGTDGQRAFSQTIRLDSHKAAIVRSLWTDGPAEDLKSGRAVMKLCERLPDETRLTLSPRLQTPLMDVCLSRKVNGKRTFRVALQALPVEWYEALHLNGVSEAIEPAAAPVEPPEPLEQPAALDVTEPAAEAPVAVAELQVASAVASALLTQVVEIIVAGNGGGSTLARLKTDIEDLQARLGQQVGYVAGLRRDLRQAQDDVAALTVERDGLRQRLRTAEYNLKVATSAETAQVIDREVHRQIDRLMRTVPGDVHTRH